MQGFEFCFGGCCRTHRIEVRVCYIGFTDSGLQGLGLRVVSSQHGFD